MLRCCEIAVTRGVQKFGRRRLRRPRNAKTENINPEDPVDSSFSTERKWKHMSIAERSVHGGVPAMLILTAALFGSLLLLPYEPHAYAVLLLIAVSGCGWVGQRTIGVMAGVVATAAVEYFFLKSTMSLELTIFGIAAIGIGLCSGTW